MDAGNDKRKLRTRSNTPSIMTKNDKENENHIEKTLKGSTKINTIHEELQNAYSAPSSRTTTTRTVETRTYVTKSVGGGINNNLSSIRSSDYAIQSPSSSISSVNVTKNALATSTPDSTRYLSSRHIRRNIHGTQSDETNQNSVNDVLEKTVGSSSSKSSIDLSSINENDHIAYKIYKAAGEYWRKYPKTDYTYSKVSPHRREIAPGVINMPNMSRPGLDKHDERINIMVYKKPENESYIRSRYETVKTKRSTVSEKYNQNQDMKKNNYAYDSQDEIDYNSDLKYKLNGTKYTSVAVKHESWLRRLFLSIITTVTTVTNWVTHTETVDSHASRYAAYHARYHEENKGIFAKISSGIVHFFQPIYLLISSLLTVDTWALQFYSRRNKKGFILFLLVLLPLLLLAGLYIYFVDDVISVNDLNIKINDIYFNMKMLILKYVYAYLDLWEN